MTLGASNITAAQATPSIDYSQDWLMARPVIYEGTGAISTGDLAQAFQTHKGLVTLNQGFVLTLPTTTELLEMFAKMVNRPLTDDDMFRLTITLFKPVASMEDWVRVTVGDENSVFFPEIMIFDDIYVPIGNSRKFWFLISDNATKIIISINS